MSGTLPLQGTRRIVLVAALLAVTLLTGYGAQRAGAQLAVDHLCAAPFSGAISFRFVGCPAGYQPIDLTAGEVNVCAHAYSGQLSLPVAGGCPAGRYALTLGGSQNITLCAAINTGKVRHARTGACSPGEWTLTVQPAAAPTSFDCVNDGDCPQSISEQYGTGSGIDVLAVSSSTGTISDVNVLVDLIAEDLESTAVSLTSPTGTVVNLYDNACANERIETVFDDEGAAFNCGAPTGLNAYMPIGSLADFDGENANGNWTLTLSSDADAGVLIDWSLEISTTGTGANVGCTACMVIYPNVHEDPTVGATLSSLTAAPPAGSTIADLNVSVDVSHTDLGDVSLFVVSPTGAVVRLVTTLSCDNLVDLQVVYDDEAAGGLNCANRLGFSSFQPVESLATFDGESAEGIWHLVVLDDFFTDQGTLNDWTLNFTLN